MSRLRAILIIGACFGTGFLLQAALDGSRAVIRVPHPGYTESAFHGSGLSPGWPNPVASAGAGSAAVPVLRVFGDYECAACFEFQRVLDDTLAALARSGRLLYVYHHAPLRAHRRGPLAAAASYCAVDQGRGGPVHRALYERSAAWSRRSPPLVALLAAATEGTGVDARRLAECVTSGGARQYVERDRDLADRLGIAAVPAVFLDGARLEYGSLRSLLRHVARHASSTH